MDYKYVLKLITIIFPVALQAQFTLKGTVVDKDTNEPIALVNVFNKSNSKQVNTDVDGRFELQNLVAGSYSLVFYNDTYVWHEQNVTINADKSITIGMSKTNDLTEVVIQAKRREIFDLIRLKDVEGTSIYAGKKNEVVLVDQIVGNKSSGNARQIYAQIAGLNIYESTNCGLQLAIGGRGLDPNRTANFNTRQNGYDISADVLGYPESYFTPPVEALEQIQIIRGAASLQYGTQFGGLINYKIKSPSTKTVEFVSRQTYDTNCGYATFNSISGTSGKFSHYTYLGYKNNLDEAPRDNSDLQSVNFYTNLNYQFNDRTKLGLEYTLLNYTAQQAGGLSDTQFLDNPDFSNRTRNWFKVNWNLLALNFNHKLNDESEISAIISGLSASRSAIGFRTNRVSQTDDLDEPRDLQVGNFNNWSAELRYLTNYTIGNKKGTLLLGSKYYQSINSERQGPGSNGNDANFNFVDYADADLPVDLRQSNFDFPNLNVAFFGENIFYLNDKLSITPGFRFEYIKTESEGAFRSINRDLANTIIQDSTFDDNRSFERNFLLLGLGISYKPIESIELYANASQNYRSVTFTDIRIVNPSFQVDPNINDEDGFSIDLGIRGRYKKIISYDANIFGLVYNDRIGEVLRAETRINAFGDEVESGRVIRFRGNLGDAFIYGLESLVDWNIKHTFFKQANNYKLNFYSNLAITQSRYLKSEIPSINKGNAVEFVPEINFRSGLKLGYKNLLADVQYSYLGEQFTDASNTPQNVNDNQSGIIGSIPAYSVWDVSLAYRYKKLTFETGVNNTFNKRYFTQRATGYPGPGIIPALPRSFYMTVQLKL